MDDKEQLELAEEIISAMKKLTAIQRKLCKEEKLSRDELFDEVGDVWEILNGATKVLLQI